MISGLIAALIMSVIALIGALSGFVICKAFDIY